LLYLLQENESWQAKKCLTTENEEERITIIMKTEAGRMTEDGDSLAVYKSIVKNLHGTECIIDISSARTS